jgi:hypothetical protein
VVGVRNGDGWFSVSELSEMLQAFHLPQPKNLSATISNLRRADLVTSRVGTKPWSLTPVGRERARELIENFTYEQISVELAGTPGAEFSNVKHQVVSPLFAPHEWQQGIKRLLDIYPFESNVFCMTRFPKTREDELPDPVAGVIGQLRSAVADHGMHLHLASDRQAQDTIFGNVGAHMWACQYGIGLLEIRPPDTSTLNDNVLMELASMLIIGRRCAILKDCTATAPPSDLTGHIYKSVDFDELDEVEAQVHRWLADDLMLGRCGGCPPPITVSAELATEATG